ncbi:MAG: ABC transporter ATP-binding protein [Rubrivivax sp.]
MTTEPIQAQAHPIELRNVDVTFEGVIQVLRSVSLEVRRGQIVSLIGGNGAGKTTTLKAISSLLAVERGRVVDGRVLLEGRDSTNADPCGVVRGGTVQVLEGRKVLHHLSVEQNLRAGAHFRNDRAAVERELQEMLTLFPKLELLKARPAGYLSGGEMQMLLVGRALMAAPRVLLLDEPSMGLAPRVVQELFDAIHAVCKRRGIAVLLVEQNVRAALQISDYGYVMENGRVVLAGSREALEGNQDVREFYLGLGSAEGKASYRDVKHYRRRKRWLG